MAVFVIKDGEAHLDPNLKPLEFWPYSTNVRGRIFEMPYSAGDSIDNLSKKLLQLFRDAGFDCHLDNKIAFGLIDEDGTKYYLGFKDWNFVVGTDFSTDSWNLKRKQKKEVIPNEQG